MLIVVEYLPLKNLVLHLGRTVLEVSSLSYWRLSVNV